MDDGLRFGGKDALVKTLLINTEEDMVYPLSAPPWEVKTYSCSDLD
jgi:hypothetical protein